MAPRALAPAGTPLDGVRITWEHITVFSDERGRFELAELPRGESVLLNVVREGYATTQVPVDIPEDTDDLSLVVSMLPELRYTVDVAQGARISEGGLTLTVPERAFVHEDGSPVTGEVDVFMSLAVPGTEGMRGTPGDQHGVGAGGAEGSLLSLLMFSFQAEQDGARVYPEDSLLAEIDVEEAGVVLPEGWEGYVEGGIPFWGYAEDVGAWMQSNVVNLYVEDERPLLSVWIPGVEMRAADDWAFGCAPDQWCEGGRPATDDGEDVDTGDAGEQGIIGADPDGPDPSVISITRAQERAVVMLTFRSSATLPVWSQLCTGTVISSRHVVTAAHCFRAWANQSNSVVQSGQATNLFQVRVGDNVGGSSVEDVIDVTRVTWHPNYDMATDGSVPSDVAVLELATDIDDASVAVEVEPIPLFPGELTGADVEGRVQAVGYGVTTATASSNMVRNWYVDQILRVWDSRLDNVGGAHSTCFGDSGGPLLAMREGALYSIGVSSAMENASCSGYTAYAAMDDIYPWIVDTAGLDPIDLLPAPALPQSYGPPPRWFNVDMFGSETGIRGEVQDVVGNPIDGAHIAVWTLNRPEGHTTDQSDANGWFYIHPVNANQPVAISAAVTQDGETATDDDRDVVYGGIEEFWTGAPMDGRDPQQFLLINPNPIVLPLCVLSGEVIVSHTDDPVTGDVVFGSGEFYRDTNDYEACYAPAAEFQLDECFIVTQDPNPGSTDAYLTLRGDGALRSVGTQLRISSDSGGQLTLSRSSTDDGPSYSGMLSTGVGQFMQGPLRFGLGEGNEWRALSFGSGLTPLGDLGNANTVTRLAGQVDVSWSAPGTLTDPVFLTLRPQGGGSNDDVLFCSMVNDGDFRIEADLINSLDRGDYDVFFFQEGREYLPMDDGTAVRLRTLFSVRREARVP
ncbi:MAG: trypsin-like serine protease [Alphaproteobacteria bacterium]|nr:trypsin-like serine protease [Alphaproteobacteria bacterium]